jgi:hypothetical protein
LICAQVECKSEICAIGEDLAIVIPTYRRYHK